MCRLSGLHPTVGAGDKLQVACVKANFPGDCAESLCITRFPVELGKEVGIDFQTPSRAQ